MKNSPTFLVFEGNYGVGNSSLFDSQTDLAKTLMSTDENFGKKKELTVRSSISQIFTGERNLSKKLREAILKVVELKFDKESHNFDDFKLLLINAFNKQYKERLKEKREDLGDRDFYDLKKETEKASEILIVTLEPAELHKSVDADELKDQLLQKTGVIQNEVENQVQASYRFYLPNSRNGSIAREFWESLRDRLIDNYDLTRNQATAKINEINEEQKLRVFIIEEVKCCFPIISLHYNSRKIVSFCVSYNGDVPSVARYSNSVSFLWKDSYFKELDVISPDKEFHFNELI